MIVLKGDELKVDRRGEALFFQMYLIRSRNGDKSSQEKFKK